MTPDAPDIYFTLITGASSGIGRALAFECASRKMNLFLVALPESGLEEVAAEIAAKHPIQIRILAIDLTAAEGYRQVYDFTQTHGIEVNTLINNAGVGYNGYFQEMDPLKVDRMILLNLRATTMITSAFLNNLIVLPESRIMNICSMASFLPMPGKSVYAASKAFTLYFSMSLRRELRHTGISVTAVCPWGVKTNDIIRERIGKSGFIYKSLALEPGEVARIAIEAMLKKKSIVIPGRKGQLLYYAGYLIPQGLVLKIMEREIRKVPDKLI